MRALTPASNKIFVYRCCPSARVKVFSAHRESCKLRRARRLCVCLNLIWLALFAVTLSVLATTAAPAIAQDWEAKVKPPISQPSSSRPQHTDGPTEDENKHETVDPYLVDAPPSSDQELSLHVPRLDLSQTAQHRKLPTPKRNIKVMSWNLDDAVAHGFIVREKQGKSVWRNTFGSERKDIPVSHRRLIEMDADIVLLQGVRSMREVRKLFPARRWRIVVSRQLLPTLDNIYLGRSRKIASDPTTAIAFRYQAGMRVTGIKHLMEFASDAALKPEPEQSLKTRPSKSAAGTAIRVFMNGNVWWFASLAFSASCTSDKTACKSWHFYRDWASDMLSKTQNIVMGGQDVEVDRDGRKTTPLIQSSPNLDGCTRHSIVIHVSADTDTHRHPAGAIDCQFAVDISLEN